LQLAPAAASSHAVTLRIRCEHTDQDPTTLVKAWVCGRTLYIEHEVYAVGCDIDKTPALFDTVPGARRHTIRADSARPETISYMRQHGYQHVEGAAKWPGSIEDGIAFIRQFERVAIHPRCTHAAEELRLYSYKVDKLSGDVLPDVVDQHNHCIDALRYALSPLIKTPPGHGTSCSMSGE
jgi:phage terminase large subunit